MNLSSCWRAYGSITRHHARLLHSPRKTPAKIPPSIPIQQPLRSRSPASLSAMPACLLEKRPIAGGAVRPAELPVINLQNCIHPEVNHRVPGNRVVVLLQDRRRAGLPGLGLPEHELLQPMLLLLLALARVCRRLWSRVLRRSARSRAKRSSHELRQALDASSLASPLRCHVRIEHA